MFRTSHVLPPLVNFLNRVCSTEQCVRFSEMHNICCIGPRIAASCLTSTFLSETAEADPL